ncbi:MAG: hypothetical protein Q9187_006318 [Circinaria calcarea]
MLSASPLDLTFGVELEFIIKYHPNYITPEIRDANLNKEFEDDSEIIQSQIFLALRDANIPIYSSHTNDFLNFPEPTEWVMSYDSSIKAAEERKLHPEYRFTTLEISSRKLSSTPENLSASLDEIMRVIKIIKAQPFEVLVNTSTGYHVHVGNQTQGFQFQILKNFCLAVYGFSHAIESIHPLHRVSRRVHKGSVCLPPSVVFSPTNGHAANLLRIESCRTKDDLFDLMNPHELKQDAYNFMNLDPRKSYRDHLGIDQRGPLKTTIEFRQHTGTMDAEAVSSWAGVATGLIQWCHYVPSGVLLPMLLMLGTHPKFGTLELLKIIGKAHAVSFYGEPGRLYQRPRPGAEESGENSEDDEDGEKDTESGNGSDQEDEGTEDGDESQDKSRDEDEDETEDEGIYTDKSDEEG